MRKKIRLAQSKISCCILYLQVLELDLYCPQEAVELLPFPELPKLKQLIVKVVVDVWDDDSLLFLTSLVEAFPNLQRFTVQLSEPNWERPQETNREVWQVAKQPHQHLEVVEISGYRGRYSDLRLTVFLINMGVALKKLVIEPYTKLGLAANEITKEKSAARYHAQRQLEPRTPVGVELVIL